MFPALERPVPAVWSPHRRVGGRRLPHDVTGSRAGPGGLCAAPARGLGTRSVPRLDRAVTVVSAGLEALEGRHTMADLSAISPRRSRSVTADNRHPFPALGWPFPVVSGPIDRQDRRCSGDRAAGTSGRRVRGETGGSHPCHGPLPMSGVHRGRDTKLPCRAGGIPPPPALGWPFFGCVDPGFQDTDPAVCPPVTGVDTRTGPSWIPSAGTGCPATGPEGATRPGSAMAAPYTPFGAARSAVSGG